LNPRFYQKELEEHIVINLESNDERVAAAAI
jgi:hypothetical protein